MQRKASRDAGSDTGAGCPGPGYHCPPTPCRSLPQCSVPQNPWRMVRNEGPGLCSGCFRSLSPACCAQLLTTGSHPPSREPAVAFVNRWMCGLGVHSATADLSPRLLRTRGELGCPACWLWPLWQNGHQFRLAQGPQAALLPETGPKFPGHPGAVSLV